MFAIEEHCDFKASNKFAQWIVQSASHRERPVWYYPLADGSQANSDKMRVCDGDDDETLLSGEQKKKVHQNASSLSSSLQCLRPRLRGDGQVVGVADTGLDLGHCFFYDPVHALPGPQHRKVVAYHVARGGDDGDYVDGHGTHVAGTVAGDAYAGLASANTASYSGIAPRARLVFHDLGCSQGQGWRGEKRKRCRPKHLNVPVSLGTSVFQVAYDDGARVHTNSWGCSGKPQSCNVYNSQVRQ